MERSNAQDDAVPENSLVRELFEAGPGMERLPPVVPEASDTSPLSGHHRKNSLRLPPSDEAATPAGVDVNESPATEANWGREAAWPEDPRTQIPVSDLDDLEAASLSGFPAAQREPSSRDDNVSREPAAGQAHVTDRPSPQELAAQRREERLAWLVGALLTTLICLVVVIVQLWLAVNKFSGKIIPTIRVEMGEAGTRVPYVRAAYEREDEDHEPFPTHPKRAGAAVDLADAVIPVDLLSGSYEQQRQAERERRQQQEQSILQEIFVDNLALQQQLRAQTAIT